MQGEQRAICIVCNVTEALFDIVCTCIHDASLALRAQRRYVVLDVPPVSPTAAILASKTRADDVL
jgi:hypothetical protein